MDEFQQRWQELLRTELSAIFHGEKPDSSIAAYAVDLWELEIPEDGLRANTVRYRPPGGTDDVRLYLDTGKGWQRVSTRAVGSYLLFETGAHRLRGAAVATIRTKWLALGALAAAVLAALLILLILRIRKKLRSRPKKDRSAAKLPPLRMNLPPTLKKKWRRIVLGILAAVILGFAISAVLGKFLIPMLRRLKAGQSIKEDGPTWHMSKQGTPTMGGIMFIAATVVTMVVRSSEAVSRTPSSTASIFTPSST